jgi:probable HAF family extracellular repeat protein
MRDLGTLGGTHSSAYAVNLSGAVAGYSYIPGDAVKHAFLYTGTPGAGGQMIDLEVWLNVNNPTEGAKWTLTDVRGLSDTGWITGTSLYDPDGPGPSGASSRAYLLDASSLVPEPGSIALLAFAAALLPRRRRTFR